MRHLLLALVMLSACHSADGPPPVALKGPLLALLDTVPSSLAHCSPNHRTYNAPFWRAPYRACGDSVYDGWQGFEVDADSVVISMHHEWIAPAFEQRVWWDREATRLTRLFGRPVRSSNQPPPQSELGLGRLLSQYCVVWRGPDSVEAVLRLAPMTDVGPPPVDQPWSLRLDARHGPLLGAVSCGLRG
jgi:hypothetical protein